MRTGRRRKGVASVIVVLVAVIFFIGAVTFISVIEQTHNYDYYQQVYELAQHVQASAQNLTVAYIAAGPSTPPEIAVTNHGSNPAQIAEIVEVGSAASSVAPSTPLIQPLSTVFEQVEPGYQAYVVVTTVGNSYVVTVPAPNSNGQPNTPQYYTAWAYGTSYYQGDQTWWGTTVQPFPSQLSDLNNNGVSCGSPYDSEAYTAVGYVEFHSGSVTFQLSTDDGSAVFLSQANSGSWTSIFGSQAWHGQGASTTSPTYQATVQVTPLKPYVLAVTWINACAPGASLLYVANAQPLGYFTVYGWEWTSSSMPSYSAVAQNPESPPPGSTYQQEGAWLG